MRTILFIFILCCTAYADSVSIDVSGMDQDQKNMIHAMVSKILFDNNIQHNGISVNGGDINITDPSGDVSVVDLNSVTTEYNTWKAANDAELLAIQQEEQARQQEIINSDIATSDLNSIDDRVNSLTNIDDLKEFIRQLARYIKAREL